MPVQPEAEAATPPAASGDLVASVVAQLDNTKEKVVLEVGPHRISLSNLNKEFWPPLGKRPALTKRDMIRYNAQVSPYLVPHCDTYEQMATVARDLVIREELAVRGDRVVITAGVPFGTPGATNILRIAYV